MTIHPASVWRLLPALAGLAALMPARAAGADPPPTGREGQYYLDSYLSDREWVGNGKTPCTQTVEVWRYSRGRWHPAAGVRVRLSVSGGGRDAEVWSDPDSESRSYVDVTGRDGSVSRKWYGYNGHDGDDELTFNAELADERLARRQVLPGVPSRAREGQPARRGTPDRRR